MASIGRKLEIEVLKSFKKKTDCYTNYTNLEYNDFKDKI